MSGSLRKGQSNSLATVNARAGRDRNDEQIPVRKNFYFFQRIFMYISKAMRPISLICIIRILGWRFGTNNEKQRCLIGCYKSSLTLISRCFSRPHANIGCMASCYESYSKKPAVELSSALSEPTLIQALKVSRSRHTRPVFKTNRF